MTINREPEKPFNFFQLSRFAYLLGIRRCRYRSTYSVTPADVGQTVSAVLLDRYRESDIDLEDPLTDDEGKLYGIRFVRYQVNKVVNYAKLHRREMLITDMIEDPDEDFGSNLMDSFEHRPRPTFSPEREAIFNRVRETLAANYTRDEAEIVERLHMADYTPEMVATVMSTTVADIEEINKRVLRELRLELGREFADSGRVKVEVSRENHHRNQAAYRERKKTKTETPATAV